MRKTKRCGQPYPNRERCGGPEADGLPKRRPPAHEEHGRRHADYETMDMDSRLIVNLRDLGHMLRFLYEGKGSQKRILILLLESGGMTQRELTERIGVQPGSASEVILKLEAAGLILRSPSTVDRRTADIELTEAGRARAQEASAQRRERHHEMFSRLTAEEKQTLLSLIEKLNGDWERRYPRNERGAHSHGRCSSDPSHD